MNEAEKFDKTAIQKIREFLHPPVVAQQEPMSPLKENWQRYYENGEYARSVEGSEEQNYSFVDENKNNPKKSKPKSEKRLSVLKKLHEKQAEIARRNGKAVPQAMMGRKQKEDVNDGEEVRENFTSYFYVL